MYRQDPEGEREREGEMVRTEDEYQNNVRAD
jgi:hypothetical protein